MIAQSASGEASHSVYFVIRRTSHGLQNTHCGRALQSPMIAQSASGEASHSVYFVIRRTRRDTRALIQSWKSFAVWTT